jgi:DNA transformation protein
MAVSADFLAYVFDQLADFATLSSRRMFSAVGLYADGFFFALIDDDDVLYFKVDDATRPDYVARGCQPLRPFKNDPTLSLNYFQLPTDVLEDPEQLQAWARKAVVVAAAAAAAKAPKRKKRKKRTAKKKPQRANRRAR